MSLHLFRVIQASVINTTHYQQIKKMCIYEVLMNRKSEKMGLVPYNFDPKGYVVTHSPLIFAGYNNCYKFTRSWKLIRYIFLCRNLAITDITSMTSLLLNF